MNTQKAGVYIDRRLLALATALLFPTTPAWSQLHTPEPNTCLPAAFSLSGADRPTDQNGRVVSPDRFGGTTVVMTMVPPSCDTTCAMRMIDLDKIARRRGAGLTHPVAFVAVATAGAGDRAALRRTMAKWKLDRARWTMVGASPLATRTIMRRIDIAPDGASEPSHVVLLFDAAGTLRQRYAGNPVDRERLIREIAIVDSLVPVSTAAPTPSSTCLAPKL